MARTVAIVQSSYIPWKGFFDLINRADELILLDDVQYTVRDWRNRNCIKSRDGLQWLTIPVEVKARRFQKIKDTVISDPHWAQRHWKTLVHNYARARSFRSCGGILEDLYRRAPKKFLSEVNYEFISALCGFLGIRTHISWSMDYDIPPGRTRRLVNLCKQAHATRYLSGPSARSYIDENLFREADIALDYMDYSGYPEYRQLFPPFCHEVSIVDLILNEGHDTPNYMKTFGAR